MSFKNLDIRKKCSARTIILALLIFVPLLPSMCLFFSTDWGENILRNDLALIELQVRRAIQGQEFVGAYSRFQWNHPGPALFYFLAPIYLIGAKTSHSLFAGVLFLNVLALAGIIWLSLKIGKREFALATIFSFALFQSFLGPYKLISPWNPYACVLPFALFFYFCLNLSIGNRAMFPIIAGVGSFLIQSHVGYIPLCTVLIFTALGIRWVRQPSFLLKPGKKDCFTMLGTLIVLISFWFLPVYQQLTMRNPNMTLLFEFFSMRKASHTLSDIVLPIVNNFSGTILELGFIVCKSASDDRSFGAALIFVFIVAAIPFLTLWSWNHKFLPGKVMGLMLGSGILISLYCASQVVGELRDYLFLFAAVFGTTSLAFALMIGFWKGNTKPWITRGVFWITLLITLLSAMGNQGKVASEFDWRSKELPYAKPIINKITSYLKTHNFKSPLINFESHMAWERATTIVLALEKADVNYSVNSAWAFMFGIDKETQGTEDCKILFQLKEDQFNIQRPDYELLMAYDDLVVLGCRDFNYAINHLYKGQLQLSDANEVRGRPGVVVDRIIPEERSPWNSPEALVLLNPSSFIALEIPDNVDIVGVYISADNNDSYILNISDDLINMEPVCKLPKVSGAGLAARPAFSDKFYGAKYLIVSPEEGDSRYSIGEICFIEN